MSEKTNIQNSEYVKPCSKCGAQERYKDGACKPCKQQRNSQWAKNNPKKHTERVIRWQRANSERHAENVRKWHEANPEKAAEASRKWRKANPEKVIERGRQWRQANRERDAEYSRKWAKANPEKCKVMKQNRRAKKKGNGGKLSKNIVQRLMTLQKAKCACGCGASLKKTGHHMDHIMPIALGGKNTDDNIQLLTPKCNLRKSAKHPDDWARENGRLI
jgi:5-methylcytosine-specific restriction endonuclease McrA